MWDTLCLWVVSDWVLNCFLGSESPQVHESRLLWTVQESSLGNCSSPREDLWTVISCGQRWTAGGGGICEPSDVSWQFNDWLVCQGYVNELEESQARAFSSLAAFCTGLRVMIDGLPLMFRSKNLRIGDGRPAWLVSNGCFILDLKENSLATILVISYCF